MQLKNEVENILLQVKTLQELESAKSKYLGPNGKIKSEFTKLSMISDPEERARTGNLINEEKRKIYSLFSSKLNKIKEEVLSKAIGEDKVDITLPVRPYTYGSVHLISNTIKKIKSIFSSMGFDFLSGPEIDDEFYVFDALNMHENHPSRDMHDSFYLDNGKLLRTHTSSVQIRAFEKRTLPLRVASVGKVYRNDWDKTHIPMFHQLEGLCVEENINMSHLKHTLSKFIKIFFGNVSIRFRPSFFPFTEPSAEIDIFFNGSWVEILGCGIINKKVFDNVGVGIENSGFAFGIGVERLAMIKHNITDIRDFFTNDVRWLKMHGKLFG